MYEIIENYKDSKTKESKHEIFASFCKDIWTSDNKRQVYTKSIRFKVRNDLLETDIGKVFDCWSDVEYKGYKAISTENNWCSLIRQKINNLYTRYFDKEVVLNKEYMYLLNTPKRLYYRWIDGIEMNADELTNIIDTAMDRALRLKPVYQNQKMSLSWIEYKSLIESLLEKIFNNCKLIDEYEKTGGKINLCDFINEDNFYIRYICKCLDGEMLKYQKKYYGVRDHQKYKRCKRCGALIENDAKNRQYCGQCKSLKRKEINHNYYIKTVLKS